jgi:SNF2 family DNA or RNA helicase
MTGTPVANRPYDIWAQIFFLDFGQSLGDDFNKFKTSTNLTNSMVDNSNERKSFEDSVASIYGKIKGFTVRETKNSGVITLPTKQYFNIYCSFEPKQEALYNKIKDEMLVFVQQKGEAVVDDSEACLKRLLRLVQVASNPRLVDELYGAFSGKEIKLQQLIHDIIQREEKVIIWSSFIENAEYFCKLYKKYNPVKIHGRMTIEDRNKSVERFKFGDAKLLFATPQAAKEGLTLTVANNVVFYDRGFNLDDYLQAQDRIHRISQRKVCNIYNLMIENSIDIWVDKLLQAKQNAAFLAQGDYKLAKYQSVMDYSYGDLIKEILNIENI